MTFRLSETHIDSLQLRARAAILSCKAVSVREIARILNISSGWVSKWARVQGNFSDKPRNGTPQVLDKAAKSLIEKTKYKGANWARKISKKLKSEGLFEGFHQQYGDTRARKDGDH